MRVRHRGKSTDKESANGSAEGQERRLSPYPSCMYVCKTDRKQYREEVGRWVSRGARRVGSHHAPAMSEHIDCFAMCAMVYVPDTDKTGKRKGVGRGVRRWGHTVSPGGGFWGGGRCFTADYCPSGAATGWNRPWQVAHSPALPRRPHQNTCARMRMHTHLSASKASSQNINRTPNVGIALPYARAEQPQQQGCG